VKPKSNAVARASSLPATATPPAVLMRGISPICCEASFGGVMRHRR
jgi:hypothetical protein